MPGPLTRANEKGERQGVAFKVLLIVFNNGTKTT